MRIFISIVILCFSVTVGRAQQKDLMIYLQACKSGDAVTVKKYAFGQDCKANISSYHYLSGTAFSTDQPGLTGFKAIVTINSADVQKTVVLYYDHTQNHWSVFNLFSDADMEKQYQRLKTAIESNNFYADKEIVFSDMATSAIAAGHIAVANKYIGMAYVAAQENGNTGFDTSTVDTVLSSLR